MSAVSPGSANPTTWDENWTGQVTNYGSGSANSLSVSGTAAGTDNISSIGVGGGGLFQPSSVPVVSLVTTLSGAISTQNITMNAAWNTIKDIAVTNVDSNVLHVSNFVDTWVSDAADNASRTVVVDGAKRGDIALGDGNDTVNINYMSNESSWSNLFYLTLGNGNDNVTVNPESFAGIAAVNKPAGWVFNQTPQATTAIISVGDGNDNVSLDTTGVVQLGSGNDTVSLVDGAHVVYLGSGSDVVNISAHDLSVPATMAFSTQRDVNNLYVGSGHASIAINDKAGATTPLTNLFFAHDETGGGNPDLISYGHTDPTSGQFVGGDWSALTMFLTGYSPGSSASLSAGPTAGTELLKVQDALTGGIDTLTLQGSPPPSLSALHLIFT
jgi:hypothetical protein